MFAYLRTEQYLGSYNAMFVGEAWADFGYYGVAVESFLLGIGLAVADLWVLSKGKSAEGVAAIVSIICGMVVLSASALQTSLFSGGILLIPFLAIVLRSVRLPRVVWHPQVGEAAAT